MAINEFLKNIQYELGRHETYKGSRSLVFQLPLSPTDLASGDSDKPDSKMGIPLDMDSALTDTALVLGLRELLAVLDCGTGGGDGSS